MSRITLTMTPIDMFTIMSEGNPGGLTAMMEMFEHGAEIDNRSVFGSISGILSLDTHGIYGSDIWILYKDICGQDIEKVLAVLRAIQLGIISVGKVKNAMRGEEELNVEQLLSEVQKQLPTFGRKDK